MPEPKYVIQFRDLVRVINQLHGEPKLSVLEPVSIHGRNQVCAFWFVRGFNHGLSISVHYSNYQLNAWAHYSPLNSAVFNISGHVDNLTPYMVKLAQLVGLMPDSV